MPNEYDNEIWKPVVGFEGWYSVSNLGRVRRDAVGPGARAGRILLPIRKRKGYFGAYLFREGKGKQVAVHRLVLLAFVGEGPEGTQANHKNGVRNDNRVENLEWVTCKENSIHSWRVLGRIAICGESHVNAKLSEKDVHEIRARAKAGDTHLAIAIGRRVARATVGKIVNRKSWAHVAQ